MLKAWRAVAAALCAELNETPRAERQGVQLLGGVSPLFHYSIVSSIHFVLITVILGCL